MEKDRSGVISEYLGHALKADGDPIGRVGRLQTKALNKPHPQRASRMLGINILGAFYVFPDSTMDSIGRVNGTSRERVRQIMEATLVRIWDFSPDNLKAEYPLGRLLYDGRLTKVRGNILKVRDLVSEGKSTKEIMAELNMKASDLLYIRKRLKLLGVELALVNNKEAKRLAEKLGKTRDDGETRQLLNLIDRNIYHRLRFVKPNVLTSVSNIGQRLGYHDTNRHIVEYINALKNAGVPTGKVEKFIKGGKYAGRVFRYYFIAAKDRKRAEQAFLLDRQLDRFRINPVSQVCGPKLTRLPISTELSKHRNFCLVSASLRKFGIDLTRATSRYVNATLFTSDCPVSIFKLNGVHYCSEGDVPELERYIGKRKEKLGGLP